MTSKRCAWHHDSHALESNDDQTATQQHERPGRSDGWVESVICVSAVVVVEVVDVDDDDDDVVVVVVVVVGVLR